MWWHLIDAHFVLYGMSCYGWVKGVMHKYNMPILHWTSHHWNKHVITCMQLLTKKESKINKAKVYSNFKNYSHMGSNPKLSQHKTFQCSTLDIPRHGHILAIMRSMDMWRTNSHSPTKLTSWGKAKMYCEWPCEETNVGIFYATFICVKLPPS
jgi:hypothetical protein